MDRRGRLLSGSLWCVLDGWASELANLAIFLAMVRLLGPAEFGLVAIALVFTSIGTELFGYSVSQVLIQRPQLGSGMLASVFWLVFGLIGSLTLGLALAAPLIGALFEAPDLVWLLRWLCLAAFLQGIAAVPLALLTRTMRFDVIAKRSLAMIVAGGTVGIGLAASGHGVVALIGLHLAQALVSAVILFGATRFRPALKVVRADLKEVAGYVLGVIGNRTVGLFDERAAQFVIGLVLGPAAVGYYNVAMRLIDILIRMFVVPINQVALPAIAQLQADPAQVRGILASGIAISGLAACPAFLGTAVIAPQLVPLALGEVWLPTVLVLQILCLRGLVWPVVLYGQSLLFGLGQPGRLLRINLVDLALNVVTLTVAAPFGLAAVALASSLRILLIRWPLVGRAIADLGGLGLRRQAMLLGRALIAAGLMSGILLIWQAFLSPAVAGLGTLALLVAGGALIYGLTLLLIFPGLAGSLTLLSSRLLRPRLQRLVRPTRGLEAAT
ncbi:MAG: lipopolysaccharide biosynthesis protein [Geminicoccaceae bacterium]|nr:lipopolysaccharide biosynthesis protein [Geminicoccaceae bacterium]